MEVEMLKVFSRFYVVVAAFVMALVPVAAFAQTPIPAADVITMATGAAADIIDPVQVTYIVIAAVGVSFALWMVRRTLKLGR
jgi:hypothetical protein